MTESHTHPESAQHGSRLGGHSWMMALMMRGMNHRVEQSVHDHGTLRANGRREDL